MYNLRLATQSDLATVMEIIKDSQALLAQRGVDQWQNGYPSSEVIERDIELSQGYILEYNGCTAAYGVMIFGVEPNYLSIYNGAWLSDCNYLTIHRLAVSALFLSRRVGSEFFSIAERQAIEHDTHSIRVDTHRDNLVMQRLLKRMGFTLCGDIYLGDNSHRFGFEKLL